MPTEEYIADSEEEETVLDENLLVNSLKDAEEHVHDISEVPARLQSQYFQVFGRSCHVRLNALQIYSSGCIELMKWYRKWSFMKDVGCLVGTQADDSSGLDGIIRDSCDYVHQKEPLNQSEGLTEQQVELADLSMVEAGVVEEEPQQGESIEVQVAETNEANNHDFIESMVEDSVMEEGHESIDRIEAIQTIQEPQEQPKELEGSCENKQMDSLDVDMATSDHVGQFDQPPSNTNEQTSGTPDIMQQPKKLTSILKKVSLVEASAEQSDTPSSSIRTAMPRKVHFETSVEDNAEKSPSNETFLKMKMKALSARKKRRQLAEGHSHLKGKKTVLSNCRQFRAVISGKGKQVLAQESQESESSQGTTRSSVSSTSFYQDSDARKYLFLNTHLYMIPIHIHAARRNVLVKSVNARGGVVDTRFTPSVTHVISGTSFQKSLDHLNLQELPDHVKLIHPDWISNSIVAGQLLDVSTYELTPDPPLNNPTDVESLAVPSTSTNQDIHQQSKSCSEEERYTDDEASESSPKKIRLTKKSTFLCQTPVNELTDNENNHIITLLQKILDNLLPGDQWRAMSYRKAIGAIKRYGKRIESGTEASRIPGVGPNIAKKIDEIIQTGKLRKAEHVPEDVKSLKLFQGIYGIGPNIADSWYAKGYRTLDDIRQHVELRPDQEIGLKYYDDLNEKMPRAEAKEIGEIVMNIGKSVHSDIEMDIMGSYRRGAEFCGDVDIIMTFADESVREAYFKEIITRLQTLDPPFIVHNLTNSDGETSDSSTPMYRGICRLAGKCRRLDILSVPKSEQGAAYLYFTGNDIFNRSMRKLAHTKGWSLSQRGLFRNVVRCRGEKINQGEKIAGETEREIFDLLKVPWKEPHERSI